MSCCLSIQGRIHVGEWGLRVITVRICSKGLPCGANGLPRGWGGSAYGLPRDCLWFAWGLPRDPGIDWPRDWHCDHLVDASGLPRDCPGIGKGFMAESVWVFCRTCVFYFYDLISHPSFHSRHIIRFVEVLYAHLTLCLHGLIVFGDWQGSALRLPGGRLRLAKALLCQGLAMELPRNYREISEQAPCDSRGIASIAYGRWIACGLPWEARVSPWDCAGISLGLFQ